MGEYYEVTDVLNKMFTDTETIMDELSAGASTFTFKQFLQTITQRKQNIYIELLQRCTNHPTASPFNAVHQHIGNKLSGMAQHIGYTRSEDDMIDDIFGNPTKNIRYERN